MLERLAFRPDFVGAGIELLQNALDKLEPEAAETAETDRDPVQVILFAGHMIDQGCDFAIAVGDGRPPLRFIVRDYLKRIFSLGLSKNFKIWERQKFVRISFRTKKPVNETVQKLAREMGGTGGGHKYACGANIPTQNLDIFLRQIIFEFQKL